MSDQIIVPTLGESVTEATVAKWLKNEGDKVNADEAIVELETDKVNVEVPAPSAGIIENIAVKAGQTVNVGTLLGTIGKASGVSKPNPIIEEKKYTPPPKRPDTAKTQKVVQFKKAEPVEEPLILTEAQIGRAHV